MRKEVLFSAPGQQIEIETLVCFFKTHRKLFVITGAGISTESGIPDYRDEKGDWKRQSPITHQQFVREEFFRKRYWSRSMVGWKLMKEASPNQGHTALTNLEKAGLLQVIVTQNVDGLHQQAGSQHVVDLHGNIARCICMQCGELVQRKDLQIILENSNPEFTALTAKSAPDGDADLNGQNLENFHVPDCGSCGGMLMPDVVFYGGSVPKTRVHYLNHQLSQADALLVIGSTLTTYSSYRYCLDGASQNKPIIAINRGVTRADKLLLHKVEDHCGTVLQSLSNHLI